MDVWCIYACKIEWMKFLCCLSAVNCDCNTFWMCLYLVHEYVECVWMCVCVSVHKAISKSIVNAHVHCTLFSCTSTAIYSKWLFSRFILLYASIEKRFFHNGSWTRDKTARNSIYAVNNIIEWTMCDITYYW